MFANCVYRCRVEALESKVAQPLSHIHLPRKYVNNCAQNLLASAAQFVHNVPQIKMSCLRSHHSVRSLNHTSGFHLQQKPFDSHMVFGIPEKQQASR
jgi:hypothetical protein